MFNRSYGNNRKKGGSGKKLLFLITTALLVAGLTFIGLNEASVPQKRVIKVLDNEKFYKKTEELIKP